MPSTSATTHFPSNSFLGWKHEKWFQEGKRLGGNLTGFRKNWITLLFPALQSETVSWNWVSAVSTQPQAGSEAEETACLAMALLWDGTPRRRKGRPSKAGCRHLRTMGEDFKAMWCWRQMRSSMNTRTGLALSYHEDERNKKEQWIQPMRAFIKNPNQPILSTCADPEKACLPGPHLALSLAHVPALLFFLFIFLGEKHIYSVGHLRRQVQIVCAKSLQSFPTLCDPMDCSPPGSSVHGIFQARTLEWMQTVPALLINDC